MVARMCKILTAVFFSVLFGGCGQDIKSDEETVAKMIQLFCESYPHREVFHLNLLQKRIRLMSDFEFCGTTYSSYKYSKLQNNNGQFIEDSVFSDDYLQFYYPPSLEITTFKPLKNVFKGIDNLMKVTPNKFCEITDEAFFFVFKYPIESSLGFEMEILILNNFSEDLFSIARVFYSKKKSLVVKIEYEHSSYVDVGARLNNCERLSDFSKSIIKSECIPFGERINDYEEGVLDLSIVNEKIEPLKN